MGNRGMSKAERQYRGLLLEAEASGKTLKAFSEEKGLPRNRLSWWKHKLRWQGADVESGVVDAPPKLLPVRVIESTAERSAAAPVSAGSAYIELVLKGGERLLRVPTDADPTKVVALVRALETSC
jgi:hypothetical protein